MGLLTGGLYGSLSEATSSLRSTSPDLAPLADTMSPFVTRPPAATWEETMSRLNLTHSHSSHGHAPKQVQVLNSARRAARSVPRHERERERDSSSTQWEKEKEMWDDGPEQARVELASKARMARMSASHLTGEDAMSGYRYIYMYNTNTSWLTKNLTISVNTQHQQL